ncbi:MAG: hypothetical protein ACI867_000714 [Glaciecola sp.]|jgi:hypothetical protein
MHMRRTKGTAVTNGVVALTIFLALAAVSLVATPPSPPSIAEFAPQAQQQIEDAPEEQSAESGSGPGSAEQQTIELIEEADPAATGTTQDTVVLEQGVPSALSCVTWPDGSVTQTFDPQSPPCIAAWDVQNGNGGATARGVTETEILVAYPSDDESLLVEFERLAEHFNANYQFYGRRLRPVWVSSPEGTSPEEQRGVATDIAELGAFATANLPYGDNAHTFLSEAAKRQVIVAAGGGSAIMAPAAEINARAPWVWSFTPSVDGLVEAVSSVVCRQLAGHPAQHSPDYATTTRKFALLSVSPSQNAGRPYPGVDLAPKRLSACGVELGLFEIPNESETGAQQLAMTQVLTTMRQEGYTTILIADIYPPNSPGRPFMTAPTMGYRPEWLMISNSGTEDVALQFVPAEAARATFSVLGANKYLALNEQMAWRASGHTDLGEAPGTFSFIASYAHLLLLASGIQMAGPNLTPETFASGLQSSPFPNPMHGAAPFYQAHVDYGSDQFATNDYTLVWWNQTRRHPITGTPGAWCYVRGGLRYQAHEIPATDDFFDQTSGC